MTTPDPTSRPPNPTAPTADFPAQGLRVTEAPLPDSAPDDPNVATIRRWFDALDRGDLPRARALLGGQVQWTLPGRSAVAGAHTGPEQVLGVDTTMRRLSAGTLRHHVLIWLAAGPHAHAVARQSATRAGVEASFDRAFVFSFSEGLIQQIHAYTDDLYAFDAFWS